MRNLNSAQNIDDLRALAQRRLPKGVYDFVSRGTEDERGLRHNREVLDSIKIKPRVLSGVGSRSTATRLLEHDQTLPLAVAPTGAAGLLWYQGEVKLARAASAAGIPYILAMTSVTPLEVVRRNTPGQLWFQLYLSPDLDSSYAMVGRARQAGFDALVVTVDTVVPANREYNWHNGFSLPVHLNRRNARDLALHPRWLLSVIGRYLAAGAMPHVTPITFNQTRDWSEIHRIREIWPGPLVLKGIGCSEDAEAAARAGVDAIVLSNHGARNLDSALSPLVWLPDAMRRVAGRVPIWIDSGFMRGSDLFKALALGARAVLLGRAALYGLAAGGEEGAARSFELLRAELDRCMAFAGVRSISEIGIHNLHSTGLVFT